MARQLLGKIVRVVQSGVSLNARIVETEAYLGLDDPASHAFRGPTPRAAIMFGPPGYLYVYLSYGFHNCMNVVTERDGRAGAVLIRALEPMQGIDVMSARRGVSDPRAIGSGPGKLTAALGIDRSHDGSDVTVGPLTIHAAPPVPSGRIARGGRIGIRAAADRPLRFAVRGNVHVSKPWPWEVESSMGRGGGGR